MYICTLDFELFKDGWTDLTNLVPLPFNEVKSGIYSFFLGIIFRSFAELRNCGIHYRHHNKLVFTFS